MDADIKDKGPLDAKYEERKRNDQRDYERKINEARAREVNKKQDVEQF